MKNDEMSSENVMCRWMKIWRVLSPNRCARFGSLSQGVTRRVGASKIVICQVKMAYVGG